MKYLLQILLLMSVITSATVAAAENSSNPQRWVADPAKSKLTFTATQEGAEFSGRFDEFNSSLELQTVDNETGLLQLNAIVQLGSVDTQYKDRDDYLKQKEWFHIDIWPEALYQAESIKQLGDNKFIAEGTLTLRDAQQPVQIALELSIEENKERGRLTGTSVINRLDFGVGQGDWADTRWVGDEVNIQFDLYLLRAFE